MKKTTLLAGALFSYLQLFAAPQTIVVTTTDNMEELKTAIENAIQAGNADITLDFATADAYFTGGNTLELPAGVTSLIITSTNEKKPTLYLNGIAFAGEATSLTVENVKAIASGTGKYITNFNTADCYAKDVTVRNCIAEGYRAFVRVQDKGFKVNSILVDNCEINGKGNCDYGLVNATGNAQGTAVGSIVIRNSTIMNCHIIADYRIEQAPGKITFSANTVYNKPNKLANGLFRLSANPATEDVVVIDKLLLSGDNGGETINGLYQNYTNITATNSWKTSDVIVSDIKPLQGLQEHELATAAMFVDPENGDFNFLPTVTGDILNSGNPTRKYTDLNATSISQVVRDNRITIQPDRITAAGAASIRVFNLTGTLIAAAQQEVLDTADIPAGVYVVTVVIDGDRFTRKFLKK